MQNGKGSKPRNCFSKDFKKNYSEINWHHEEFVSCGECGQPYKETDKYTKMQFMDGEWRCWKCNWN